MVDKDNKLIAFLVNQLETFYSHLTRLNSSVCQSCLDEVIRKTALIYPECFVVIETLNYELQQSNTLEDHLQSHVRYPLIKKIAHEYCLECSIDLNNDVYIQAIFCRWADETGFGTPLTAVKYVDSHHMRVTGSHRQELLTQLLNRYTPQVVVDEATRYIGSCFPEYPFPYDEQYIQRMTAKARYFWSYLKKSVWDVLSETDQADLGGELNFDQVWPRFLARCQNDTHVNLPNLNAILLDQIYDILVDLGYLSPFAALKHAVCQYDFDGIKYITKRWPSEVSQPDAYDQTTPVYEAIMRYYKDVVSYLVLKLPVQYSNIDGNNMGLVEAACYAGDVDLVDYLIQHYDFNPNKVSNQNFSVMQLAALYGQYQLIEAIQSRRILPAHQSEQSWYLFNLACHKAHYDTAYKLFKQIPRSAISELSSHNMVRLDNFCECVAAAVNRSNHELLDPDIGSKVRLMLDKMTQDHDKSQQNSHYYCLEPIYDVLALSLQDVNSPLQPIKSFVAKYYEQIKSYTGANFLGYVLSQSKTSVVLEWLISKVNQDFNTQSFDRLLLDSIHYKWTKAANCIIGNNLIDPCQIIEGRSVLDYALASKNNELISLLGIKLINKFSNEQNFEALSQLYQGIQAYIHQPPNTSSVDLLLMIILKKNPTCYGYLLLMSSENNDSILTQMLHTKYPVFSAGRLTIPFKLFSKLKNRTNNPGCIALTFQNALFNSILNFSVGDVFNPLMMWAIGWSYQITNKCRDGDLMFDLANSLKDFCQACFEKLTKRFRQHGYMTADDMNGLQKLLKQASHLNVNEYWFNFNIKSQVYPYYSLVHHCVAINNKQLLMDLLEQRHVTCRADTVLHTAISQKLTPDFMNKLIDKQASVNICDDQGEAPLVKAMRLYPHDAERAISYIYKLLSHGAYPQVYDRQGYSIAQLAAHYHSVELLKLLNDFKTPMDQQDAEGNTLLHYFVMTLPEIEIPTFLAQITVLLQKNVAAECVDLSACNKQQETCLHAFIRYQDCDDITPFAEYLPRLMNLANAYGQTPIHYAIQYNKPEVLEYLMQAGADIMAQTHQGHNALDILWQTSYSDHFKQDAFIKSHLQQVIQDNLSVYQDFEKLSNNKRVNLANLSSSYSGSIYNMSESSSNNWSQSLNAYTHFQLQPMTSSGDIDDQQSYLGKRSRQDDDREQPFISKCSSVSIHTDTLFQLQANTSHNSDGAAHGFQRDNRYDKTFD